MTLLIGKDDSVLRKSVALIGWISWLRHTGMFNKSKGKTLVDFLNELYGEFGYLVDIQESQTYPGIEGAKIIEKIVDDYRYGDFVELEGRIIVAKEDYKLGKHYDYMTGESYDLTLPKSNVIKFFLEDGSWIVCLPSGNEPKIKLYKNLWKKSQFAYSR